MAVVRKVLPCKREVNKQFRICNFRSDARVRKFLEDENFLKYGIFQAVVRNKFFWLRNATFSHL